METNKNSNALQDLLSFLKTRYSHSAEEQLDWEDNEEALINKAEDMGVSFFQIADARLASMNESDRQIYLRSILSENYDESLKPQQRTRLKKKYEQG